MIRVGQGSKIYETSKIVRSGRTWKADIRIGKNCLIGDHTFLAVRKLVMEEGSQIGPHAVLSGGGKITLGKFSVVGFGVQLISGTDTTRAKYMCEAAPENQRHVVRGSITLGEGSYLGSNAVICVSERCPDIVIGKFSVVGALSYLDKSVPAYTIAHPSPNLVMKERKIKLLKKKLE